MSNSPSLGCPERSPRCTPRAHWPFESLLSEIADVVGADDVTVREVDKLAYAQDYFWLSQMWLDRGQEPCRPVATVGASIVVRVPCPPNTARLKTWCWP
jgi:hypothetical protein